MKRKRPGTITLLAILVLILAAANLARLVLSIQRWDFLAGLLPVSPAYLALSGLVWTIIWLPLAWGLLRGLSWAPRVVLAISLAYSVYIWIDRLLLPNYAGRNANWPFALISNLLMLAFTFWALFRPKARVFFGDTHDR